MSSVYPVCSGLEFPKMPRPQYVRDASKVSELSARRPGSGFPPPPLILLVWWLFCVHGILAGGRTREQEAYFILVRQKSLTHPPLSLSMVGSVAHRERRNTDSCVPSGPTNHEACTLTRSFHQSLCVRFVWAFTPIAHLGRFSFL